MWCWNGTVFDCTQDMNLDNSGLSESPQSQLAGGRSYSCLYPPGLTAVGGHYPLPESAASYLIQLRLEMLLFYVGMYHAFRLEKDIVLFVLERGSF